MKQVDAAVAVVLLLFGCASGAGSGSGTEAVTSASPAAPSPEPAPARQNSSVAAPTDDGTAPSVAQQDDGAWGAEEVGAAGGAAPLLQRPPGLAPSAGPIIPAVTAQCPDFTDSTITFMGLPGIRVVAGPKPNGPTAPMVFYWHGTSQQADMFEQYDPLEESVRAEGGVLISFQSSAFPDLLSGTLTFGGGDFPLVDQLVACAVRDHNVDPRQIFTTGCSAGGLFASALAAERSQYIAAAAPDSGGWIAPVNFQNDHTPALMTIHGAAGQDVVVVDFSQTSALADDAFKMRGGAVINCDHGLDHCDADLVQPSLVPYMWQFFKAHRYGDESPWQGGLPDDFHWSCQLY